MLCGGRLNGILDGRTATKEEVGYLMTKLIDYGQEAETYDYHEEA